MPPVPSPAASMACRHPALPDTGLAEGGSSQSDDLGGVNKERQTGDKQEILPRCVQIVTQKVPSSCVTPGPVVPAAAERDTENITHGPRGDASQRSLPSSLYMTDMRRKEGGATAV